VEGFAPATMDEAALLALVDELGERIRDAAG
jgi:hypothetical protein